MNGSAGLATPGLDWNVLHCRCSLCHTCLQHPQALAFVDSHARTLTRILHDAASPGIRCG